jgi:hypothetical protein
MMVNLRWIGRAICVLPVLMATTAFAVGQEPLEAHGLKMTIAPLAPTPTPFPLDVRSDGGPSLKFVAPGEMSAADRQLVDANQAEIVRRAGLQGFNPGVQGSGMRDVMAGGASWGYEQAVCPVMPDYVILEFSRNGGGGDVSMFSAVIPRGEGHVRVIPVRRRGYSLWTPPASNTLTVHDFNMLVKQSGLSADWLSTGLCYAALAGGHLRAALEGDSPESFPMYAPAVLRVSRKGGAVVDLADAAHPGKGTLWSLDFAQDGRLLKVKRSEAPVLAEKPVKGAETDTKLTPVKESAIDLEAGKQ